MHDTDVFVIGIVVDHIDDGLEDCIRAVVFDGLPVFIESEWHFVEGIMRECISVCPSGGNLFCLVDVEKRDGWFRDAIIFSGLSDEFSASIGDELVDFIDLEFPL